MSTTTLDRTTRRPDARGETCQVYRGSLLAPCPNPSTRTAGGRGTARPVCAAHSS